MQESMNLVNNFIGTCNCKYSKCTRRQIEKNTVEIVGKLASVKVSWKLGRFKLFYFR